MWTENNLLMILLLCFVSQKVAASWLNSFPNFYCGKEQKTDPNKCEIFKINSASMLQNIYERFDRKDFKYENDYNTFIRDKITSYNEFEFKQSTFEKFPTGSFGHFSHVLSITAKNVGLSTLNRDSLLSFTSLEVLDLSHNKIQSLENNILSYMKSLRSFNVSNNQISILNDNVFHEFGNNLTYVDLSHNYIKVVSEQMLESLGRHGQINLHLCFNDIEEINILNTFNVKIKLLDLRCNKLGNFSWIHKWQHIVINEYNEVSNGHQFEIEELNLRNNSLINIKIFNVSSLDISDNINIKDISLNLQDLRKLISSNVSSKAVNYDFLQNANQLIELDVSNIILGTPKFETFSEMTKLEVLKLSNTGLSHIEHGMFGHQANLKHFDISNNNLRFIDIEMLSNMKSLKSLDISGNNLTYFCDIINLKKNFENFTLIGIEENNWNCSYLAKIVKAFEENAISIKQPAIVIKNSSHVRGIGCHPVSRQENKSTDSDHANDLISQKLDKIIERLNKLEIDKTSSKRNGTGIISILIAMVVTVLLIGSLLVCSKLKTISCRRNETPCVLARSTNTSNMTIEIPFDDRKF